MAMTSEPLFRRFPEQKNAPGPGTLVEIRCHPFQSFEILKTMALRWKRQGKGICWVSTLHTAVQMRYLPLDGIHCYGRVGMPLEEFVKVVLAAASRVDIVIVEGVDGVGTMDGMPQVETARKAREAFRAVLGWRQRAGVVTESR